MGLVHLFQQMWVLIGETTPTNKRLLARNLITITDVSAEVLSLAMENKTAPMA